MILKDKRVTLVVIAFVVLIGIIIGIVLLTREPSTGIKFIVVPDSITVTIDGKKKTVDYESILKTDTGPVTVELKKDGFTTKTQTVEVKEGELSSIYVYLEPISDSAKKEVSTTIMQQRITRIGGYLVSDSSKKLGEKYPFINKMPIVEKYYTLTPCSIDPVDLNVMGICVTLAIDEPVYREQALETLLANDIDPTKWTIIYGNQFDFAD